MQNPLELNLARVNLQIEQNYQRNRELLRERDFIEKEIAANTILLSAEVSQEYNEYYNKCELANKNPKPFYQWHKVA